MAKLIIKDLHVQINEKEILKGINLEVDTHEIHAIMGPNGQGKSTLLSAIMGDPKFTVTKGSITFDGKDVLAMSVDERSRVGIFLGMQYPAEIPGVNNSDFMRAAMNARLEKPISLFKFIKEMEGAIEDLGLQSEMAHRNLNEGFSGGEKKRNEIVQMKLLKPSLAMLDEIDSGLDVDALQIVANAVYELFNSQDLSLLIVSHYERFLDLIKPTHVHVLLDGKIQETGGYELIKKIDTEGYDWVYDKYGVEKPAIQTRMSLDACGAKK
ncbi:MULTISPECIES: Fe-S cluster assembly ATPase SufC [Breznakia]|uniref:Fe-S cluster assembly ATP-binding protein n=1 Tax=Breznakia blatticola TaxID=1754012 RepID=A0A4V3G647_9FIRM|nr:MULTISPECIES: Fe-S cluster assembly ATPase SufC [Breznakia]MDH6367778.1 Fe-S cluster assembly ATP-binding protein [Breznakia sp. PH1-1]MDH6404868.1 Fe-S cluster assembly ATP-binding protein [Breznakia sp. PF1-11]MDH6412583.1 Fe-S cluster assembly ATP-binding protein [Breznakia sp. PFB1-11]MDH6414941.1 Fe-S cluster assembly ATP-binding protein [Breznakia sp. PFB1-14]MDH6417252.1 Fe-S cluster assembly ATP-binding protein [Breznakia sp. PFB1-4]